MNVSKLFECSMIEVYERTGKMEKIFLGKSKLEVPRIGLGCMRMADKSVDEVVEIITSALESGINFFDHADMYGDGQSERIFGEAIQKMGIKREEIIIQSKCSIRPDKKTYDFSKEHILNAVNGSLDRLGVEYLDVLLLHRPDALFEGEEVAAAFDELEASGKVRNFGVSNQHPGQMALLQKYLKQPIVANQIQMSVVESNAIDSGINVNTPFDGAVWREGGVIEYARLHDITLQPWSPFLYGYFEGVFIDSPKYPELNACLQKIGEKYGVSSSSIAIAWLLRHPAKMQPLVGTTNPDRIRDIATATDVKLTREEWYELYQAAGHHLP